MRRTSTDRGPPRPRVRASQHETLASRDPGPRTSGLARPAAGDLAEPPRMMEARPRSRHGSTRHRPERSRHGNGAEVDVKDDGDDEADEGDVVQQNRKLGDDL